MDGKQGEGRAMITKKLKAAHQRIMSATCAEDIAGEKGTQSMGDYTYEAEWQFRWLFQDVHPNCYGIDSEAPALAKPAFSRLAELKREFVKKYGNSRQHGK